MREVVAASGAPPQRARRAHVALEASGLVATQREGRGAVRVARVRLTLRGRQVARLLAEAEQLMGAP